VLQTSLIVLVGIDCVIVADAAAELAWLVLCRLFSSLYY
jgi:hypothetical protein